VLTVGAVNHGSFSHFGKNDRLQCPSSLTQSPRYLTHFEALAKLGISAYVRNKHSACLSCALRQRYHNDNKLPPNLGHHVVSEWSEIYSDAYLCILCRVVGDGPDMDQ
jgi:hypothetical protein